MTTYSIWIPYHGTGNAWALGPRIPISGPKPQRGPAVPCLSSSHLNRPPEGSGIWQPGWQKHCTRPRFALVHFAIRLRLTALRHSYCRTCPYAHSALACTYCTPRYSVKPNAARPILSSPGLIHCTNKPALLHPSSQTAVRCILHQPPHLQSPRYDIFYLFHLSWALTLHRSSFTLVGRE